VVPQRTEEPCVARRDLSAGFHTSSLGSHEQEHHEQNCILFLSLTDAILRKFSLPLQDPVGRSVGVTSYSYRLAVPRDTALSVYIASHDLKLGDATGAALAANASQQAFQHVTGDANPKSFSFSVLGLLP